MTMRITARGQVTIPKSIREQMGWMQGSLVDVTYEQGAVMVRPKVSPALDRVEERVTAFQGTSSRRFETAEPMALLRSDD